MAEMTAIAWEDWTCNFWIGCTKVGPGCDNCYAIPYADDMKLRWGDDAPRQTYFKGKTRDKIGALVGISGRTVEKIVAVCAVAEKEPKRFGHLKEQIDRPHGVDRTFHELRRAQDEQQPRQGRFLTLLIDPSIGMGSHFPQYHGALLVRRARQVDAHALRSPARRAQREARAVLPDNPRSLLPANGRAVQRMRARG
jgi:hypothetical protein